MTRRTALSGLVPVAGAGVLACQNESPVSPVFFDHGIASGDPTENSIVIWTRVTTTRHDPVTIRVRRLRHTTDINGPVTLLWQVSTTPDFSEIIRKGRSKTGAHRDYTVKVEVTGLKPGTQYYYRFNIGKYVSPVGRTKTLPAGRTESAKFALVSCSNYPFGFFNVYRDVAAQADLDAVLHLGDYFYEYGRDGYGGAVGSRIGREHVPAHETITLADYRLRHALYKSDPDSQAMHAAHPLIPIWDDHETANNSWKAGAENHSPGEGDWNTRRAAAIQAYYEWMPVRDPEPGQPGEALFRTFEYGDLATLCSIETRLSARTRQIEYLQYKDDLQTREGVAAFVRNVLNDPESELMGKGQKIHISAALRRSKEKGQPWRLIANQTIMARVASPDISDFAGEAFMEEIAEVFPAIYDYAALSPLGLPVNPDAWDGYPAARERFYAMAQKQGVRDLLVLTGDTHESWVNRLTAADGTVMGMELGAPAVTSPGNGMMFGKGGPEFSKRLNENNEDILYHDFRYQGYILLTLSRDTANADFISVNTVTSPDYETRTEKRFTVSRTDGTLGLSEG